MAEPHQPTRPAAPVNQLPQAIELAKAGRKAEACEALRQVVAQQPLNQPAWLWLSAVAANRPEAEAALAQARRINPAHPSLVQAERWLEQRFSAPPVAAPDPLSLPPPPPPPVGPDPDQNTRPTHRVTTAVPRPTTQPMPQPPKVALSKPAQPSAFILHPSFALGLVILALLAGLVILLLGLALEVNATALPADSPAPAAVEPRQTALEQARAARNWGEAIAILEVIQRDTPNSPAINEQLAQAYLQKGIALRHKGFIEEAIPLFKQALKLKPGLAQAQQELHLATRYLEGVAHYHAGRWPQAITAFEAVRASDSGYVHLTDLLFSAYYNHGLARQAAADLTNARQALTAAMALRPDLPEPRRQMAEVDFALAPQTPLITATPVITSNKLILVGIDEQRMNVYEGDELVFDFIVSTGEPGRDTAVGEFEILDKIDMAYASTWNLDMPYWMGIYWAGPLENGIHALPIVKHTGYKLWDGYLGQRVSYGCVILGDDDAATLFKWADIGTKVKIVPSLTYALTEAR